MRAVTYRLNGLPKKSGSLEKQPPGLKPRDLYAERFRGFENPLPRTEVRGWHNGALLLATTRAKKPSPVAAQGGTAKALPRYKTFQEKSAELQIPRLRSPDFLLRFMALMHFMRLSLLKGAHAALSSAAWQEIRVGMTKEGRRFRGERLLKSSRFSSPWCGAASSFVRPKARCGEAGRKPSQATPRNGGGASRDQCILGDGNNGVLQRSRFAGGECLRQKHIRSLNVVVLNG